ncbi:ALP1-like protein, partial [Tanacetum coccineum]
MYTPQFLDSFKNTGYSQEPNREESHIEAVATSPQQIAWTHEEEITLCKRWVDVSKNSKLGNSMKEAGFWCAVLAYMESKTKLYGRRTAQESGAEDEDYFNRALMDYQDETGTTFKYRHCWEILKNSPKWKQSEFPKFAAKSRGGSKRYKSSGSSSFNTESEDASINLNTNVGDNDEDEVQEIRRPMCRDKARDVAKKQWSRASGSSSMNDESLARMIVKYQFEM